MSCNIYTLATGGETMDVGVTSFSESDADVCSTAVTLLALINAA